MKLLEWVMDFLPGLRRVRVEQARRDQRATAQQHRATALDRRADHVIGRIDRTDRIANEMRSLGQAFRQ